MLPKAIDDHLEQEARLRAHRDAVHRIEDEMRKCEHWPIPVRHYFAHGVYAREVTLPAGAACTGRIHKYENLNIISKGRIRVSTENGVIEICAPATFVSPPGTKRLVHALEETVWTTILGTDGTDPERLVDELTVASEEEYEQHLALIAGKVLEIE